MALTRFVVLKSNYNNKYLSYVKEECSKAHGFLQFHGEEIVSPYSKYEMEMAKNGNGLVNIRCCYNNKYWIRQDDGWIAAKADEPEEDETKSSCTLFEPVYIDDAKTAARFRHVECGYYACLWRTGGETDSGLYSFYDTPDRDKCDVFTIIDWESLLILPKHVAFKGDNGGYLSARSIDGRQYLLFNGADIGDPTVGNELFTTCDGNVRIKSNQSGKFWRWNSDNWILADSDDTSNDNSDTLFWPIKVDNRVIALRNLGNKHFCKRLTIAGKRNHLSASISTISMEARLEVEELVLSRNIYNIKYHLIDARIYNKRVLTMAKGCAINNTQQATTVDVKLAYTEKKRWTWNTSISLKIGVKTNIETGVPLITNGKKIKISDEFTGDYKWGETVEFTSVVDTVCNVTVPPMTMMKVSLLAIKGSCDVPFFYSQRDTLTDGQQIISNMEDGVFTGINCFNFKYETKQEKL